MTIYSQFIRKYFRVARMRSFSAACIILIHLRYLKYHSHSICSLIMICKLHLPMMFYQVNNMNNIGKVREVINIHEYKCITSIMHYELKSCIAIVNLTVFLNDLHVISLLL